MKWGIFGALVLVGGIVVACDPLAATQIDPARQVALEDAEETLRAAYCERMFSCACEYRLYTDVDACMDEVRTRVAILEQQPRVDGMFFDAYCLGEKVDELDELDCAPPPEDYGEECERPCFLYHGDVHEGRLCHTPEGGAYSDCSKRLVCSVDNCTAGFGCTGTCVDPCMDSTPSACGSCEDDELCDEGSGMCVPLPLPDLGEPCTGHSQCQSGFCPAGYCAVVPGQGESCATSKICAQGTKCDELTMICVPGDALVCTLPPF